MARKRRAPRCPKKHGFTPNYLARMVAYFEDTPVEDVPVIKAGMWVVLKHKHPHLIDKFKHYFLSAEQGDPIYALYNMCSFCDTPTIRELQDWIETCKFVSGSTPEVAVAVAVILGDIEWGKTVLERGHFTDGKDVAMAAYTLCSVGGVEVGWAKKLIASKGADGLVAAKLLEIEGKVEASWVRELMKKQLN